MTPRLLTIEEAAKQIGVPRGSLRTAAEAHGFIVRMGRTLRIDQQSLPELIRQCQENQKALTYTSEQPECGLSEKGKNSVQRAQETAERLKRLSPGTSQSVTGPPAQIHPIK